MSNAWSPTRLIDVKNRTASREIFVDRDVYRQEQEQIFARAWLFVGHECQVPNPDDFYVSRMGEESVILTRDRQGKLHVFLNTCRHRGMKLCRHDEGNTRVFSCPYHAWSYSTDGALVSIPGELFGVPGYKKYYHEELDKQEWGLVPVPQMINYRGTIWATWDKSAAPFEDYLGSFKFWLDSALDHRDGREGGSVVLVGVQKWRTNCNWKFPATNFVGDAAHVIAHRSVDMVNLNPSGTEGRRDERAEGHAAFGWPDLGHGGLGFTSRPEEEFPRIPSFQKYPHVSEYLIQSAKAHQKRRAGKIHQQGKGTIFPNMSFHEDQPRTIIVHHPNGPTQTEFWRYYLVDADAPTEVKDTLRHYYMTYSGPGGMTEQDDLENWASATEASQGAVARRFPYNYQQGLRYSVPYEGLPGAVWCGERVTEQPAHLAETLGRVHGSARLGPVDAARAGLQRCRVPAENRAVMDGAPKGFEAQALRLDVEDFLHAEADLVDDRKFDQWLALFSEDLQYRMPIVRNIAAPSIANEYLSGPLDVSWFDEGKKLRRPWHAPSEHGQFADTAVTHYGRHVVRKHTGHRRKVAGRISQSAGERDDGGLAFGDAVEIAHDAAYGRSGSFLAWFNAASLRSFI